jgi:Family of unknown function (DUF5686)/CarboxypepD_reg-like domain
VRIFSLILSLCFLQVATAQTVVFGVVQDAATQDELPYVTIQSEGGKTGVRTDIDGNFFLQTDPSVQSIRVSYVGYETQLVTVLPNQRNELKINLVEKLNTVQEISIRPEKYQKKNPAVDLVEQVFLHKDQNRKEGLDYYQFEKHERLRFDINGVTDKFRSKWYFKRWRFAFDYCDTNQVSQKVELPFYFRERILETYYRNGKVGGGGRNSVRKDKLLAERQTAFDDGYDVDQDGISAFLNVMYQDVDIYEASITMLDKQFIGPLSGVATTFYRFYITDTVVIGNEKFADVFFAPKNKNDLAFMGNMLVALDSTYAVRRVEMGISKDINLNWVKDLRIEQDFEFQQAGNDRRLMLVNDRIILDLAIWKTSDGRSLLASKTGTFRNFLLNQPLPDSLFDGKQLLLKDTGNVNARSDSYWSARRHATLNNVEKGVGVMLDSVKSTRLYKVLFGLGSVGATGFYRVGPIDIGEAADLYSFNQLEGDRLQLTVRSNERKLKKVRLKAFAAYGFEDLNVKGGGSATFAFKSARPGRFPANQLRLSYTQDLFYPGANSRGSQSLLNSLQRGATNRLLLNQIPRADYTREFKSGFSFSVNGQYRAVREAGLSDSSGAPISSKTSKTTEFGTWIRYAPNEKFYQARESRVAFNNKWPVFFLQYKASVKGLLGGEYAYQRTSLRVDKIFYLGAVGRTHSSLEHARVIGQVSYPFLEIPRANQTYFFDDFSYSLMNYLEFISDQNTTLRLNHDFQGVMLNRVPLIKKLHLREGVTFKAIYGSLSKRNIPTAQNNLLPFPTDKNGATLTTPFGAMPYMEASVGVSNILNAFRIDYVWRLTYRDAPGAVLGGPRLSFGLSF